MKIKQYTILFTICFFSCSLFTTVVQAEDFGKKLLEELFKKPADKENSATADTQQQNASSQTAAQTSQALQKQITYSGYSKAFIPVKTMFACGRASDAITLCNTLKAPASNAQISTPPVSQPAPVVKSELGSESLQQGMKGPKVAEVQECLSAKGVDAASSDGVFGKGTKAKVMEFQRTNNIEATGVVDQKTWDALHNQPAATLASGSEPADSEPPSRLTSEVLTYLENGNLAICAGNANQAIDKFASAEHVLAKNESSTKAGGWFNKGATFAMETLLGNEELGDYSCEGYERVLMLNLKSIAFLLEGKREAYNVTRRSINWQETEKKRFEDKIRSAKQNLAAEEMKQKRRGESFSDAMSLTAMLAKDYAPMDTKATTVPSAYVNPFGYYVAGMVQEFESYNEPSLRDNAYISYKKALEFNPGCRVLREIVADIKNPPPQGKRLVHVVAGDGFVPEKRLLRTGIKTDKSVVPVKLPIYVPMPSQVSRIEVTDIKGKNLATLSTIADVEAICLRNQKDGAPLRELRLYMTVMRSAVEQGVSDGLGSFGKVFSDVRDKMTTPDMRSWMTLPASMQAARFYIPASTDQIKIVTYDITGKKLATSTVTLDSSSHNFVSVRSIDRTLYVQANKKMWFAKN